MCDESTCARDLAAGLEDKTTRTQALGHLEGLRGDEFDDDCVVVLVGSVVALLDVDNRFSRMKIWDGLVQLAETYPAVVVDHVPEILATVPADGESWFLERFGSVLGALIENGMDLSSCVEREYATALREAEPNHCRRAAIELFAQYGDYRAFVALEETADYELGSLSERAREALDYSLKSAVRELDDSNSRGQSDSEAHKIVRHVTYENPTRLERVEDGLFDLFGDDDGDVAIRALSALVSNVGSESVKQRLVETVEIDERVVQDTAGTAEEPQKLREAEDALATLIRANETDAVLEYVLNHTEEWLHADSEELHEHGLRQLRILAERAPDAVEQYVADVVELAGGSGVEWRVRSLPMY